MNLGKMVSLVVCFSLFCIYFEFDFQFHFVQMIPPAEFNPENRQVFVHYRYRRNRESWAKKIFRKIWRIERKPERVFRERRKLGFESGIFSWEDLKYFGALRKV